MDQAQKLKNIYDGFAYNLRLQAEKALEGLAAEFLPYAQTDLELNVYMRSSDIIKKFLLDKDIISDYEVEDKAQLFQYLNSKEVREKMLDEFKDELVNDIISDQQKEIANLKERIKWQDETIESYRR